MNIILAYTQSLLDLTDRRFANIFKGTTKLTPTMPKRMLFMLPRVSNGHEHTGAVRVLPTQQETIGK